MPHAPTPWIGLAALVAMFALPFLPTWLFEGPRTVKHRPQRHVCADCGAAWTNGHVGAALAELPNGRTPTRHDWERLARRWQAELDTRIRHLQQLRDDFTDCVGCGCLSIDRCHLANRYDRLAEHGQGPRRLLDPCRRDAVTPSAAGAARSTPLRRVVGERPPS